jgi:hypothetical protein
MSTILRNARFIVVWWDHHYWFIIWSHQFDLNHFVMNWELMYWIMTDVDEETLRNTQNSAKHEFGVTHDNIIHFMNPNLMCRD